MRKTFKRELGAAGLVVWSGLTTFMFGIADLDRIEALTSAYDHATWAIWAYAAGAFGMQALATQFGGKA